MRASILDLAIGLTIGLAINLAGTTAARAQNAANGEALYGTAVVQGKLSCSANACHGNLSSPQNRIASGTQAAAIKSATQRVSQMRFLEGQLSDAQFNELAAYIAGKLGSTGSYLTVVATPVAVLSPASVNFGSAELLATSAAQTLTVGNAASASAPLVLGAITTSAGSDFSITGGTCRSGASLDAGTSCTVLVAFTPSATGTRSALLNVVHSGAGGGGSVSLTGMGSGEAAVATAAPSALSFSQTLGSRSAALRVLLANSGTAALRLSALRIEGTNAADFSIGSTGDCAAAGSVAPGQNCSIDVSFAPAAQGARSATLVVEHNAAGGRSTVALAGSGNTTPQPGLMLDAVRLDLGNQAVFGTPTPQTLTVTNNGQADLGFSRIAVSGARAGEFALGGSCVVGTAVAAQGRCTITVALTPTQLGAVSATLEIASNAPAGTATVTLAGAGVASAAPAVTLSQAALGFGTVAIGGSSAPRTALLRNSGNAPMAIQSLATSSSEFTLTHDCPATLAADASCSLRVVFAPTSANAAEVLMITTNAPSSPNNIVLTGLGSTSALPVLDWAEGGAPIVFGDAAVGSSAGPVTRTLVNRGPGIARLSTLNLAGSDAAAFVVGGGSCGSGTSLPVNASCTVNLRFVPSSAGTRSAVLQVASDASSPPELVLGGTGSGVAAAQIALSAEPTSLDYRASVITTGQQGEALLVRIVNGGSAASTLTAVTVSEGFRIVASSAADACPGVPWTLAAGAACSVAVAFAPATGGETTGTLKIVAGGTLSTEVALAGAAKTEMTNVGSTDTGGGALDPVGLLALLLACAATVWRRRARG